MRRATIALGVVLAVASAAAAQEGLEQKLLGTWRGTRTASGPPECPLTQHDLDVDKRPVEIVWVRTAEGELAAGEILDGQLLGRVRWTVAADEEGGATRLQRASTATCLEEERQDVALFGLESRADGDELVLTGATAPCPALKCTFEVRYKLERAAE